MAKAPTSPMTPASPPWRSSSLRTVSTPFFSLGSGLVSYSQKMMVAASTMAAMKVWAQRS